MVQIGSSIDLGLVSQCNVTNCTYNQSQQCTAGAIDVSFMDKLAQCYTYTEQPVLSKQVRKGVGDVSQCDVIDCNYNEGQRCIAKTIAVTYQDDIAQCATYTVSNGRSGG